MTTHESTRRDNHVIPIHGKKRTTYKVLIRRKVNGVNETFCETYKNVLSACPNWYSEPAREAIDTMLATISQTIADHKAAKQAQG